MAKFFKKLNPELAKTDTGYKNLCLMKRKGTEKILQFVNQSIDKGIFTQDTIEKTAHMGNGKIKEILTNQDPYEVLTEEAQNRLAYTIFYLLPSLGKKENFERTIHGKRNTHAVYEFRNDEQRLKYKQEFAKVFGQTGDYLVTFSDDFEKVEQTLDHYHRLFNNRIKENKKQPGISNNKNKKQPGISNNKKNKI